MFIKSSEGKITKGVFTYYIITEGGGGALKCLWIITGDGEGVGLVVT